MLELFLITSVGVAAAQASPGPNLVAVASTSLGQGRRAGLLTTLGICTGMMIWAVAMSLGLGTLISAYPLSLVILKIVGGGYLIWLAVRSLVSAWRQGGSSMGADTARRSGVAHWKRGLFIVLTNPKAALMWAAVATFLFGAGLGTWQVALFGPVGATSGFLIYGGYAVLFSTQTVGGVFRRFTRSVETLFGAAFGVIGAKLIFDGARTIRE